MGSGEHALTRWLTSGPPSGRSHSWFGDCALVLFLTAQVADGALTYVGVATGAAHELNPVLGFYMGMFGVGPALTGAKLFAGSCAIVLHIWGAHHAVAALTVLYAVTAVVPWTSLLFLS